MQQAYLQPAWPSCVTRTAFCVEALADTASGYQQPASHPEIAVVIERGIHIGSRTTHDQRASGHGHGGIHIDTITQCINIDIATIERRLRARAISRLLKKCLPCLFSSRIAKGVTKECSGACGTLQPLVANTFQVPDCTSNKARKSGPCCANSTGLFENGPAMVRLLLLAETTYADVSLFLMARQMFQCAQT